MLRGRVAPGLSCEGEVVHPGDAEHGLVDAVAFEAAVTEDLPGLHAGEGVLDAGADLFVGPIVLLFPGREFGLAAFSAVWDEQSGAWVAAVGDCEGLADGGLHAGFFPCLAVVSVPGERPEDLPVTAQRLREDRILEEAAVTGADPQHLCAVFNITPDTGLRYTRTFHPDPLADRDQEDTP
jgi:hypothetical protein